MRARDRSTTAASTDFNTATIIGVEDRWAGGGDGFEALRTEPLVDRIFVIVIEVREVIVVGKSHVEWLGSEGPERTIGVGVSGVWRMVCESRGEVAGLLGGQLGANNEAQ